jgi:hypothetical protein
MGDMREWEGWVHSDACGGEFCRDGGILREKGEYKRVRAPLRLFIRRSGVMLELCLGLWRLVDEWLEYKWKSSLVLVDL